MTDAIGADGFAAMCANEPELAKLRGALREFLAADRVEFALATQGRRLVVEPGTRSSAPDSATPVSSA